MCMIDGVENCEVWHETWQRARKSHRCDECNRTIQPSEEYNRVRAIFQGDPSVYKACQHCMRAGEWLDLVCDGWLRYGLSEDLREHLFDYESWWLRLAVSGVSNRWTTKDGHLRNVMPEPKPWLLNVPGLMEKLSDRAVSNWRRHWRIYGRPGAMMSRAGGI